VIRTEPELLNVVDWHGFDFRSTVQQIAARFPMVADYGVASSQIVPFRLRAPLLGEDWKIPVNRGLENDLPPFRYCHEFHPTQSARENHDRAETELRALLGPGESGLATNVYERNWRLGFFQIRVLTWPRELNLRSSNVFEGKNPHLWISANITIEPDFPFIDPVEDASMTLPIVLEQGPGYSTVCQSQVYARRNRVFSNLAEPVVGIESSDVVIRGVDRTVRVPLEQIRSVKHTRVTPGRFGGSSSLDIETVFLNRHSVTVYVAKGKETDSLDRVAKPFANAISKPLTIEEYSDDG